MAEGETRFEALRTETGAVPTVQSAPKDLNSELQRMQGIDELLQERSEWMGTHQREIKIPIDSGVISRSTRMEALIDEAESNDHVWREGPIHVGQVEKVFGQVRSERC